jgi:chromosome segregation ATPase
MGRDRAALRRHLAEHHEAQTEAWNGERARLIGERDDLRRQLERVAEQAATRLSMLDDMTAQRDQWQRDCEQSQALVAELCSDVWDEQIRVCELERQLAEARADGYWEQHGKRIEGEPEQARERAATLRIALGGMIQAAEIAVETNPCACEEDGMCGVCIGAMRLPAARAALDAGKEANDAGS